MRLVSSVGLLPLCFLAFVATDARGFDRPVVEIQKPSHPAGMRISGWTPRAGTGVTGRIVPPLKIPVEIRVEHQFEDGKTLQELKVSLLADADGRFLVSFAPPRGGWLPGRKKTIVCIQDIQHVSDSHEWSVVGPPAQSADFAETVIPLPKADHDVDLGQAEDLPALRSERTYLLKGSFPHDTQAKWPLGPKVLLEFRKPTEKNLDGIICDSWITTSFPRDERTCDFEIEVPLKSHLQPGLYLLRTTTLIKPGAVPTIRPIRILPRDEADDPEKR